MGVIDWLAFVTGVASVVLTVRQSMWCWPIGLVNVALVFVAVLRGKLYADAALMVFFFVLQLYGWYRWTHGRGVKEPPLRVTRAPRRVLLGSALFVAVTSYSFGRILLGWTDAHFPYWDAVQAMLSVVAQWMIARKYLENWLLWIVVNVLTIGLYCAKQLTLLMGLYVIYLGLAVAGYYGWRASLGERVTRRRMALHAVGFGLLLYLGLATWITVSGFATDLRKVDCIVVPGARVLPDGSLGPSIQARVEQALELYRLGYAPALIFTGGAGESGPVEAECARNYAVARGIPPQACFLEGRSHNTVENFLYAREVMREHGWTSCLVTTDAFHSGRAVTIARRLGLEAYPAPTFRGPAWTSWGGFAYYTSREVGSWLKFGLQQLTWSDPAPQSSPPATPRPESDVRQRAQGARANEPIHGLR